MDDEFEIFALSVIARKTREEDSQAGRLLVVVRGRSVDDAHAEAMRALSDSGWTEAEFVSEPQDDPEMVDGDLMEALDQARSGGRVILQVLSDS